MPEIPTFLHLFVDKPLLIAIPIVFLAVLALWSRSHTVGVAAIAWNPYLVYELGIKAEEFCSGLDCMKRTPVYGAYPLLALVCLLALVQGYVHLRDKRHTEGLQWSRFARHAAGSGAGEQAERLVQSCVTSTIHCMPASRSSSTISAAFSEVSRERTSAQRSGC